MNLGGAVDPADYSGLSGARRVARSGGYLKVGRAARCLPEPRPQPSLAVERPVKPSIPRRSEASLQTPIA